MPITEIKEILNISTINQKIGIFTAVTTLLAVFAALIAPRIQYCYDRKIINIQSKELRTAYRKYFEETLNNYAEQIIDLISQLCDEVSSHRRYNKRLNVKIFGYIERNLQYFTDLFSEYLELEKSLINFEKNYPTYSNIALIDIIGLCKDIEILMLKVNHKSNNAVKLQKIIKYYYENKLNEATDRMNKYRKFLKFINSL